MLPAVTSASGRVIGGRYRLLEPIGHGGMGVVWLAHDDVLDRQVALKEVAASTGASEDVRERMLREARAAARLDHPGAVRIYDVVDEDDARTPPWIVMEVLTGCTLKDAINDDGPLPPKRVAEIGAALLDALGAAHRAGIVHRDVKPANVQLCDDGRVVLTDFGIASMAGDSSITRTGDIVGSPAYMSPERARGQELGPESDLFALGATLYAAVEGSAPFERETPIATLTAIVSDPPAPCRRAGPLAPVLDGLLAKDPTERMTEDQARERLVAITRGDDTGQTAAWSEALVPADATQSLPAVAPTASTSAQPQQQEVTSTSGTRGDGRRWLSALLAVLIILGVAGGVVAWLVNRHNNNGGPGNDGSSSSSSQGPFSPGQGGVPGDWATHQESGWSIATPKDWARQTQSGFIRFKRPPSQGSAYIAVQPQSGSDPAPVLSSFVQSFSSHDGYHEVSKGTEKFRGTDVPVTTVTYRSEGADLEASFLAYPVNGQVFLLWWQTLTSGWNDAQDLRATVLSTFRASG
jgi:serine/threonine protein kinase